MKLTRKEKLEIIQSVLRGWLPNEWAAMEEDEDTAKTAIEIAYLSIKEIEKKGI